MKVINVLHRAGAHHKANYRECRELNKRMFRDWALHQHAPQSDVTQGPSDSHSDRPNLQPLVREEGRKQCAEHQTEFTPP